MRISAMAMFLALTTLAMIRPASAQKWQLFDYPDSGVSIQFPADPQVTQGTYPSDGGSVPSIVYAYRRGSSQYTLTVADFSGHPFALMGATNRALSAVRNGGGVKLDLDECISGQEGREFSVVGGDGSLSKIAIFASGSRLFVLEAKVSPPNVLAESGDATRFQQSMSFGGAGEFTPQFACRGRAREASRVYP